MNGRTVRSVLVLALLLTTAAWAQPTIGLRHVKSLESPFPIPDVSGNSHLLPGVSPGGPCLAVSFATTYEDCRRMIRAAKKNKRFLRSWSGMSLIKPQLILLPM